MKVSDLNPTVFMRKNTKESEKNSETESDLTSGFEELLNLDQIIKKLKN